MIATLPKERRVSEQDWVCGHCRRCGAWSEFGALRLKAPGDRNLLCGLPSVHSRMDGASPTFEFKVFTADELRAEADLLHDIATLAIDSFREYKLFDESVRFEFDTQVCMELGDDGICVIMFDVCSSVKATPIAVACAKVPEDVVLHKSDSAAATIGGRMVPPPQQAAVIHTNGRDNLWTRRGTRWTMSYFLSVHGMGSGRGDTRGRA